MRQRIISFFFGAACLVLVQAPLVTAGMASPLPTRDSLAKVFRLNESAVVQFQAISFFLLAILLAAWGIKLLWNYLQRDFPKIPRLSFMKALGVVLLWGLLFIIVLAMIGGARELMTPGAWEKQGFTYKLVKEPPSKSIANLETVRRQHLELLRTSLWQFAATHMGHFPSKEEMTSIPKELWEIPGSGGSLYIYHPGKSAGHNSDILLFEPEIDSDQCFVLRINGDILMQRTTEIKEAVNREGKP
jgi:hypothetical protein